MSDHPSLEKQEILQSKKYWNQEIKKPKKSRNIVLKISFIRVSVSRLSVSFWKLLESNSLECEVVYLLLLNPPLLCLYLDIYIKPLKYFLRMRGGGVGC